MAVYSMTGFASQQCKPDSARAGLAIGLELRSVNSRFLDFTLKAPEAFKPHEARIRQRITDQLGRGKVELRIFVRHDAARGGQLVSAEALQRLGLAQDQILAWFPRARELSVAEVLQWQSGEQAASEAPLEWDEVLDAALAQTLDALLDARAAEGERLAQTLRERSAQLRALAAKAAPMVPQLVEQQRQRFLERWNDAMALAQGGQGSSSDPREAEQRALAEATAFAMRIDVAEELTRLVAHLDEIEALLNKGGVVGKRLDFLIQELHREANTLGSKAALLELSRISMEMKVLVEQMREQVQNLV